MNLNELSEKIIMSISETFKSEGKDCPEIRVSSISTYIDITMSYVVKGTLSNPPIHSSYNDLVSFLNRGKIEFKDMHNHFNNVSVCINDRDYSFNFKVNTNYDSGVTTFEINLISVIGQADKKQLPKNSKQLGSVKSANKAEK